jgi:heptaprenyl diphosphate synthase
MINQAIPEKNGTVADFNTAFALVREEVNKALSSAPLIIRGYTEYLMKSKGKFIRAISVITCAQKEDGAVSKDAVRMAAAIEILHLATLVHDDVIDDAGVRRGVPTLQKKYGKRTAVICGDYLLSAALKMASSIYRETSGGLPDAAADDKRNMQNLNLPDYVARICLGELNQHINNGNLNLTVFQYLKIISGKTAALFEASFCAGAVFSGCGAKEINKYRRLGRQIGMIFQLIDDCMDFEADESVAQKPVQSDFEQNVITLPLIRAIQNLKGFKEVIKTTLISRNEINEAVKQAGGIAFARMIAKKYYGKSLRLIGELDAPEEKKEALTGILNKVYREF